MQDITELQRRLSGALERIGHGLEALGPVAPDGAAAGPDPSELAAALAAEQDLTAQLEERIRATRDRFETRAAEADKELRDVHALLAAVESDRNRLKLVAETLTATCAQLRDLNAQGVADGDRVNDAMTAEIDALRTMRDSDRGELNAIIRLLDGAGADAKTPDSQEEVRQDG